ncbi:hypothetical protein Mgra_00001215, partial [Meloidogyne graminicola]
MECVDNVEKQQIFQNIPPSNCIKINGECKEQNVEQEKQEKMMTNKEEQKQNLKNKKRKKKLDYQNVKKNKK